MKKNWPVYLTYISVIFLIFALYRADYLFIPDIHSYSDLGLSFVFLGTGFLLHTWSWKKLLLSYEFPVTLKNSIESFGLSVLGKYIPGKVWMLVGMSGHILRVYNYPLSSLLIASLSFQFITLWTGLLVGSIGLFFIPTSRVYGWIVFLAFLALSFMLFNNKVYVYTNWLIEKFFKRKIDIPFIGFKKTFTPLILCLLMWVLYGLGFYYLTNGLLENSVGLVNMFSFALASSAGVLALFAPGGLGVREGILTFYLTSIGVSLDASVTISLMSRLWFFVGELFTFMVAFFLNRKN